MEGTTGEVDELEYKTHANALKEQGNELFQAGKNEEAIQVYTQAIDLDPDNHVFYSNRSAAYMKNDSKSKALKDAEKCVALAPAWSKGYARLGAAQQALKRFDAAIDTFKKGIELDATNQSLWSSLRACQESHEADKKIRFADAAIERQKETDRLRRADEQKAAAAAAATAAATAAASVTTTEDDDPLSSFFSEINAAGSSSSGSSSSSSTEKSTTEASAESKTSEEDLLSGFFSEVLEQTEIAERPKRDETLLTEKYTTQDLGEAKVQYERIMAKNYEWRNLNPYYVLQLDIDATDEDIKQRYRKMAAKLHPDKMRDVEDARECFEQIKTAYQKLCDEKEKNVVVMNIEHIKEEVAKERRKLVAKGVCESPK